MAATRLIAIKVVDGALTPNSGITADVARMSSAAGRRSADEGSDRLELIVLEPIGALARVATAAIVEELWKGGGEAGHLDRRANPAHDLTNRRERQLEDLRHRASR